MKLLKTSLELQGIDVIDEMTTEIPSVIVFDAGDELEHLDKIKQLKDMQEFVDTRFSECLDCVIDFRRSLSS